MKSYYTLLFLIGCLISSLTVSAQDVTLSTTTLTLDSIDIQGASLIAIADEDELLNGFDKWLKKNYDINIDRKKMLFIDRKLITTEDVSIPVLSDKNINFYVRCVQHSSSEAELKIGARDYTSGAPIESRAALKEMQRLLINFASEYLIEYNRELLSDSRDTFEDLSKDIRKAEDKISNNHKKIDKMQRENEDLMREIEEIKISKIDADKMVTSRQNELDELEKNLKILRKKIKK